MPKLCLVEWPKFGDDKKVMEAAVDECQHFIPATIFWGDGVTSIGNCSSATIFWNTLKKSLVQD